MYETQFAFRHQQQLPAIESERLPMGVPCQSKNLMISVSRNFIANEETFRMEFLIRKNQI